MAIFSDPTEGNCGWLCDATFVGDKPYDGNDGTNLPWNDNDMIYALMASNLEDCDELQPGNGTIYEGFSANYSAAVYANARLYDYRYIDPVGTDATYFGHLDPGNFNLYVTENGQLVQIRYSNGQRLDNGIIDPYDYSQWIEEPISGIIEQNGFFAGRFETHCAIWYGKWKLIKARVRQYNIEGYSEIPYPWGFPDDFTPHGYLPLIIRSTYNPSSGISTPVIPTDGNACKWTCKGYTLPSKKKESVWRIKDQLKFTVQDQYGNSTKLSPCPSPDGDCESIRLAWISPYWGGEECECPEGTIECQGRDGRKCCLKCCDLGAYVLNLFEGATQNANFNG